MHKSVRIKQKGVFEHAQNTQIRIVMRTRSVSSEPQSSFDTFNSSFKDSVSSIECLNQTAECTVRSGPCPTKTHFCKAWLEFYTKQCDSENISFGNVLELCLMYKNDWAD